MVMAMGPLYGVLLKQDVGPYIQHLGISLILWIFLSVFFNESCMAFITAEGFIKQIKLPITVYLFRVLAKNFIALMHNALIIVIILFFYPPTDLKLFALLPIGLILVLGNMIWIGLLLSMISTRFRDIPQVVTNLMQLIFFISPIMWKVDMLGRHRIFADINPLYHFMELIRAPLLGELAPML